MRLPALIKDPQAAKQEVASHKAATNLNFPRIVV